MLVTGYSSVIPHRIRGRFKWDGGGILKTLQDIQDLNHLNTSEIRWSVQVQAAGTLVEVEDAARKGEMGIISFQGASLLSRGRVGDRLVFHFRQIVCTEPLRASIEAYCTRKPTKWDNLLVTQALHHGESPLESLWVVIPHETTATYAFPGPQHIVTPTFSPSPRTPSRRRLNVHADRHFSRSSAARRPLRTPRSSARTSIQVHRRHSRIQQNTPPFPGDIKVITPPSTLSTSLASLPPSPPLHFAPAFHSQDHRAWRFKWDGGGVFNIFKTFKISKPSMPEDHGSWRNPQYLKTIEVQVGRWWDPQDTSRHPRHPRPQHLNTSRIRWSVQVQAAGTSVEVENAARKGEMGIISFQGASLLS
ncbi:hypothetical protein NLI96_g10747 [Meripilus lineatus]|uniref:Uncharacterized protein n=1 Tax=Meripilus lineatus TaxID=2056292 RepID=A0AAD5UTD0_9APHY|nr:hypothetical protein NLI96_g10747 [Physisporinus lineatus]